MNGRRRPLTAAGADRGSATLWLLAVGLLLVAAGTFEAAAGTARLAGRQAQVAADLGALAGAIRAVEGPGPACARAAEIASANGARLVGCQLAGLDLLIRVRVTVRPVPWAGRAVQASARAGPVRG
ncbi:helicase [Plantactinospora sp. KBS50]|nr:helicase [Plantactinospora sp. KBS50]